MKNYALRINLISNNIFPQLISTQDCLRKIPDEYSF